MKTLIKGALVCFVVVATAAFSFQPYSSTSTADDIVDVAVNAGSFETLVAAVTAADLVATLKSEGPFTVFAPTDEAFAKLPEGTVANLLKPENKDQLVSILTYHVVAGKVMSSDLLTMTSATTVNGQDAPIGLRVGNANVISADIEASNGVIHVIDAVLMP
ncbi:MAG: fasciclin domain-containing protein [Rhodothermales bacterium]|nr:fasciclin domain-containing protein [Rhodothermales bacterium]